MVSRSGTPAAYNIALKIASDGSARCCQSYLGTWEVMTPGYNCGVAIECRLPI